MRKAISILLFSSMLTMLCACGTAPVRPDPIKTVKSALEIVHCGKYGDIYAAMKKVRADSAARGGGYETADTANGAAAPTEGKSAAAAQDYSSTNVQVAGVDEGDIVKTDGRYIYAIHDNELLVYKPDGAGTKLASRLTLASDNGGTYPSELYVSGDRLAVVLTSYEIHIMGGLIDDIARPGRSKVSVAIYDITNPESPKALTTLGQDGSLTDSRMLNGKIYVVSYYCVTGDGTEADPKTFTPCTYDGGTASAMPVESIAVLPSPAGPVYAVVCAYDLKTDTNAGKLSVLGGGQTIYMNEKSLYLENPEYGDVKSAERTDGVYTVVDHSCSNTTTITAVDLASLTARSCGTVPGTLFDSYSMDEYGGCLRAATTNNLYSYSIYTDKDKGFENYKDNGGAKTVNAIYILDSGMNIVGRAENIAPGETIFSARFDGSTAYLCTFKQTDPLFSYDLSDPKNPVKLGEMKITGFSEYLHVWSDGRLFGLGQSANDNGGVTGMKMVMFDISDKKNVGVKSSLELGPEYSAALSDPNAILVSPDRGIVGFPLSGSYVMYSYSDAAGFIKLASVAGSDWEYNMRGLYIGYYLYIVGQGGVTVIDMKTYSVSATVKI